MIKFSLIRDKVLPHQPKRDMFAKWIRASIQKKFNTVILSVSIVDKKTSQLLNKEYRAKDSPTNVISLEYSENREVFNMLNGELILCDEIIVAEAKDQNKPVLAHYAHMIVHGMLHLQGYDHIDDMEAEEMEQLEADILARFGFANPYIDR